MLAIPLVSIAWQTTREAEGKTEVGVENTT